MLSKIPIIPLTFTVIYAVLLTLLSGNYFNIVWLLLGLVIGVAILVLDEAWLFKRYADPQKPSGGGLITRSIPFLLIFLALSIFVVTSSASLIGVGVIASMGSVLAWELWQLKDNRGLFIATFSPLHPDQFSEKQQQQGIAAFITIFLALLAWAL